MLGLGLKPGPHERARDKYRILARALLFNLIAVPGLGVLVTRVTRTPTDVTNALLLLAAAPGGGVAPHLAAVAGGDVALSTEITLLLAKITVFTAPVTAEWILGLHQLKIDELPFLVQLALLQLAPLYAGRAVRRWYAGLADRLERTMQLVVSATVTMLFALVVVRRGLRTLWLIGDRGWIAVVALAAASLVAGWSIGGPTEQTRRAVAISANSRQLALALVMARVAFPDRSVQLATFGVWGVLCGFNYTFARLARRLGRTAAVPNRDLGAA